LNQVFPGINSGLIIYVNSFIFHLSDTFNIAGYFCLYMNGAVH
jgi:hypothetical protein